MVRALLAGCTFLDAADRLCQAAMSIPVLALRSAVGGVLMGLANLVPGISGGTMLLAAGVYPRFIQAIADVSTLKLKKESIVVLGVVGVCVIAAIVLLAGPVKTLVVEHRWVMYSIFIGLTLGGVPVVWEMAKPANGQLWGGAVGGFLAMALIALAQASGATGSGANEGFVLMFVAGVAGASAMILPGVSGGYLLLVFGVYVPILGGIDAFKNALKAGDVDAAMEPTLGIVLPVGLGVVIGILVVSNLLKMLLQRFEKPTLGVLLGFLVGAVVGLWPFQHGVAPKIGDTFKGQVVTAESLAKIAPDKYPTETFDPSVSHIVGALGLIVAGFLVTALIARFGKEKTSAAAES
jgi:putative membrane protein